MDNNTAEFDMYIKGRDYNNKLIPPYYQTIDKNYRYYGVDHWRGVKANGNPTPIFPITKQIVDYKISSIVSSKTKMQYSVENIPDNPQDPNDKVLQQIADLISGYSFVKWEKLKMDSLIREVLLKGAVTGDMCFYTYWDSTIDSHSTNGVDPQGNPVKVMGDFVTEVVSGANVMFGNPNDRRVQTQPYILLANRDLVSNLRAKAKANKMPQTEIDKIVGDTDTQEQSGERGKIELDNTDSDNSKCLYLIKLWKDNGKVMMKIVTKSATIQKDTDTGLTLYPIAWANWDLIENSYHGQAEVTGIVPNQILVNQLAANIAIYMKSTAFGKVIYDKTKIAGWDNRVTGAIGVEGEVAGAVQQIQPGQMNNMVMTFFEKVVQLTKDIAGANDAALGNVDPKNTSAIIAVQKQSSIPLEAVKDRLYQLIEDLGYIWLDFMLNKYEVTRKISYMQNDKTMVGEFNGSQYKDVPFKLKIDVGPSLYYSSIASMQTLDSLLQQNRITFIQYLERVENGIIPKTQELIDEINRQNQVMEQQQNQQIQLQQQQSSQSQHIQQQTEQLQTAKKQLEYAQLKKFFDTLPQELQKKLLSMPDAQMEATTQQLYQEAQKGNLNPQNNGNSQQNMV